MNTPSSTMIRGDVRDVISMTWPQYLRRECVFDGKLVSLSPSEAALLATMLIRRGLYVTADDLLATLYPDPWEAPEWDFNSAFVLFMRLRKKVPGLIGRNRTMGFYIDTPPAAALASAA